EMPSPIADEFGRVYEEQNLGIALEEAMRQMCERVPNLDLRFFVTSVAIQRQTGGDLAEILDKIGYVVRERYRILGQVKALTAEGRLSGIVLIALPFALFVFMLHIKPDYVSMLWTHPLGIKMSVTALIMQILGAIVIKKIVDIKV
ncbi:MAG TPA: type II secretion system F family protein, partial [Gemmataceae bacterium]|nr:type II secretion system F family protein [Gemmataceae bacterium]